MKVRAGRTYLFHPVPMDRFDPKSQAVHGQRVVVVALRGCPPPNTMGHAHINAEDGTFLGLVHCNSLVPT